MATVKAVLNKDRPTKHGNYALVIQIIHQRVKRVIYTPYKLRLEEFDAPRQRAVYVVGGLCNRKKIKEINSFVEARKKELQSLVELFEARGKDYTSQDIVNQYRTSQSDRYFVTFVEHHIESKESQGKMGTARAFRAMLRSIRKYIGDRNVEFSDIDHNFIRQYEEFLNRGDIQQNTVGFYLRNLRTICNLARDSGAMISERDPFDRIKIRTEHTVKRALKQEVVERIANMDLSHDNELDKARDVFMFSFYTRGMSFVDIIYLKHIDIVDGVIYYRRHKTNQDMQVAVTKPLQNIIEKYNTDDTYVLPFINHSAALTPYRRYMAAYGRIYRNLNMLRLMLGLSTPLTTYVARHSWATIAKEKGVSTTIISEGLGHTSEKTTSIYLKEFDRSVLDIVNEQIVSFK